MKERPIDGDLEQLLEETRDKRDPLQQHLIVYENLRVHLEALGNSLRNQITIRSWNIMKNMLTEFWTQKNSR